MLSTAILICEFYMKMAPQMLSHQGVYFSAQNLTLLISIKIVKLWTHANSEYNSMRALYHEKIKKWVNKVKLRKTS